MGGIDVLTKLVNIKVHGDNRLVEGIDVVVFVDPFSGV